MTERFVALVLGVLVGALLLGGCNQPPGSGPAPGKPKGELPEPPLSAAAGVLRGPRLTSVVGDTDRLLVSWDADSATDLALFVGPDADTLFAGPPVQAIASAGLGSTFVGGQTPGAVFVGLAAVAAGAPDAPDAGNGGAPVAQGPILAARIGAPLYVRLDAPLEGADGLSPETAFPDPLTALITAFIQGGANIWIAGGDYADSALPLFSGVHLAGGFAPDMALETRDPALHPTRLLGRVGQPILSAVDPTQVVVVDGVQLVGGGLAPAGVDAEDGPLQLRGLDVSDCVGAGIRLRAGSTGPAVPMLVLGTTSRGHGGEGLSAAGSLALHVEGCRFENNVQEGIDLDDLIAPAGETVSLTLRHAVLARNGTEGLDVDLSAPFGAAPPGHFEVLVRDVLAEANGRAGLLIDIDYDSSSGWTASVTVHGSVSRGNAEEGLLLDLDAPAAVRVHRVDATGNAGDGMRVTADTAPTLAMISASASSANLGAGLRVDQGAAQVLVSHAAISGNLGGGLVATTGAVASSSSVARLQAQPWIGAVSHADLTVDQDWPPVFRHEPRLFGTVIAETSAGLQLTEMPGDLVSGQPVSLGGEETARFVAALVADTLTLDPAPANVSLPAVLAAYQGIQVVDDYAPAPLSAAVGAGLTAPGAAPRDAGPFGAPFGGPPGGSDGPEPSSWSVTSIEPPLVAGASAQAAIEVLFSGAAPDPTTVDATTVTVRGPAGELLSAVTLVEDGALVIDPRPVGWPSGTSWIELHVGLRSLDGQPILAPLALPVVVP